MAFDKPTRNRLGGVESPLYAALVWARLLKKALDNGLRDQLTHLRLLRTEIEALPDFGLPAQLKQDAVEQLTKVHDILGREFFFEETAALGTAAAELDRLVACTTTGLARQQNDLAQEELSRWQATDDWMVLNEEDRGWLLAEIGKLAILVDTDLEGLKKLLRHDYSLNHRLRDLATQLAKRATENRKPVGGYPDHDPDPDPESHDVQPPHETHTEMVVPKIFKKPEDIDSLIAKLNALRLRLTPSEHLRITWKTKD